MAVIDGLRTQTSLRSVYRYTRDLTHSQYWTWTLLGLQTDFLRRGD